MGGTARRNEGVYGPGSFTDTSFVPVPLECKRLLKHLALNTPGFTNDVNVLDGVTFEGEDLPVIPGPIKSQAMTTVLHAMVGIVGQEILELREIPRSPITVNTTQASMYCATPALVSVDGIDGIEVLKNPHLPKFTDGQLDDALKIRTTSIYPTSNPKRWYQLHGSTLADPVMSALGIKSSQKITSYNEAYELIKQKTLKLSPYDLDMMMLEKGLCGSICYTPQEWRDTKMGKDLARYPLINYKKMAHASPTPPVPFSRDLSDKRPLAGVKVLELARIIAAPASGMILASLGAEVVRVQARHKMDFTPAQLTLMAGKSSYDLNLDDPSDSDRLWELVKDADVILQGYRLRSLEHRGFGLDAVLEMASARGKGIIYLDENCYGLEGYMAEPYGLPEGQSVLPSLPIADMSTGVVAALEIMMMLRERAKDGGSWHENAALTAFQAVSLEEWVGLYQPEVVAEIQEKFKFKPMTSDLHVIELYYLIADAWKANSDLIRNEKYYTHFYDSVYGKDLRTLAPVIRYGDQESSPRWTGPPVPFCQSRDARWAR
ncbi:acetyl-coenzyme A transferase nodX [Trichoderma asperellum]|uniref:Acetyl-coenzyme A transferase nodX n=1 Tax=Trichoderma asperellum TaxID=101201 RepID=A0A6V8R3H7_TRIAP|nr:acetyl-coenzyme A transferase nodX [Trichoderma asperellum]